MITEDGRNLKEILEKKLKLKLEGKCSKDGFCKPGSIQIMTFSSGLIRNGDSVQFEVVLEGLFAHPVEGMLIEAQAKNVTKAGIRAVIKDVVPEPLVIFISRDHYHMNDYFQSIQEGDSIVVRVIGQRFELNDPFISVIGELVKQRNE